MEMARDKEWHEESPDEFKFRARPVPKSSTDLMY